MFFIFRGPSPPQCETLSCSVVLTLCLNPAPLPKLKIGDGTIIINLHMHVLRIRVSKLKSVGTIVWSAESGTHTQTPTGDSLGCTWR